MLEVGELEVAAGFICARVLRDKIVCVCIHVILNTKESFTNTNG